MSRFYFATPIRKYPIIHKNIMSAAQLSAAAGGWPFFSFPRLGLSCVCLFLVCLSHLAVVSLCHVVTYSRLSVFLTRLWLSLVSCLCCMLWLIARALSLSVVGLSPLSRSVCVSGLVISLSVWFVFARLLSIFLLWAPFLFWSLFLCVTG